MADRKTLEPRYLGDGVYIHDEGYGLNMAVNHHDNKVIFLEDFVIKKLIEYINESEIIKQKPIDNE